MLPASDMRRFTTQSIHITDPTIKFLLALTKDDQFGPNDLSTFFNFSGNNDILSFFKLIQRYLRMLYQIVNQMICHFFSTPVGTKIFYLFFTSFKDIRESCIRK